MKRLQRETGITFVFVTHDQDEALSMSDRIAVMSHGKIAQLGSPHDIYDAPATRFVADFIGNCNFVPAASLGFKGGDAPNHGRFFPMHVVFRHAAVQAGDVAVAGTARCSGR